MAELNSSNQPRSFSVGLYILIVFVLSWPFQIISSIWAVGLLPRYILNSLSMMMVTVGTFIIGKYIYRENFSNAGWQWGKAKHYFTVISFVLILWIVPTLVGLVLKQQSLPTNLTVSHIVWILVLLFVTLIPGFGEEFGWRGYLLPHLASRLSVRKSVTIHAIIWWAWHLPVLVVPVMRAGIIGAEKISVSLTSIISIIIFGSIPAIMHGIIFAYIWTKSRSLAVATVYHAAYDGVRDSLGITIGISPLAGIWANLLLVILGSILLWKGDWSNLKEDCSS